MVTRRESNQIYDEIWASVDSKCNRLETNHASKNKLGCHCTQHVYSLFHHLTPRILGPCGLIKRVHVQLAAVKFFFNSFLVAFFFFLFLFFLTLDIEPSTLDEKIDS